MLELFILYLKGIEQGRDGTHLAGDISQNALPPTFASYFTSPFPWWNSGLLGPGGLSKDGYLCSQLKSLSYPLSRCASPSSDISFSPSMFCSPRDTPAHRLLSFSITEPTPLSASSTNEWKDLGCDPWDSQFPHLYNGKKMGVSLGLKYRPVDFNPKVCSMAQHRISTLKMSSWLCSFLNYVVPLPRRAHWSSFLHQVLSK